MLPPQRLIQKTIERYQERSVSRENHIHQLVTGSVLDVDTPERVSRRLERIARNPVATSALSAAKVSIKNLSTEEFNRIVQERILGQRDLMSISYLEYGLQVGRSVCRIILRSSSGRVMGYGTGFLVSPCLLLTNNHVLSSVQDAMLAWAEFNYQSSMDGLMLQSFAYELDPTTLFITNEYLDYSLVAVKARPDSPPLSDFGWNSLIEEQGKVILGEYLNIIQHPEGEPKQVALRENRLVDLLDDFLHYQTDTAPGSSGSPVFNDQWEVVGLHHSGVPKMDDQGNFLAIDGSIWTPEMGENRIDWVANEAIRISRIVKDIKKQQNLSQIQRNLRSQMFDGSQVPKSSVAAIENQAIATTVNNSTVTWTIPLQVSVNLGQTPTATFAQPSSATVSPISTPDVQIINPQQPNIQLTDIETDPELQAELGQLERLRQGEVLYYNEAEDISNRDSYYGEILSGFNSLNKSDLFNRLHQLLETTHNRVLAYNPKRYLYPWVDLQPDLKIRSIYSQLEYTPEQIIREDVLIERMRASWLREMMLKESLTTEKLLEKVEILERDLPYNCEHVVPQSWFGKAMPMKGDLHHLFACEIECNSYRGNSPYTDFPDFEEAIRNNCGKSAGNKFEPGYGKGAAARATLYFLLRYPTQINNTNKEYKPESIETLIDWHKKYPVSEHEKHRNMAIANSEKQGNRNPLIDFPEWVDFIDFTLGIA
ncbi:MAG: endonuclease [Scytonema sp. PMC 1069.18]|nr:endonuclease [Scytonema sp. PMC 1069.18]MEC4884668.1 endonuclease [Scytonema sp. PMC 1070.18]